MTPAPGCFCDYNAGAPPLDDVLDWAGVGDDAAPADRGTPPGLPALERPDDAAAAPRKLWHSSPGSSGR